MVSITWNKIPNEIFHSFVKITNAKDETEDDLIRDNDDVDQTK